MSNSKKIIEHVDGKTISFYKKHKMGILLAIIWFIVLPIAIGLLLYFTKSKLLAVILIIMAIIASVIVIIKYSKKNKCVAHALTWVPFVPANRIYTGHMKFNWDTLIRLFMPFLDLYYLIFTKKLDPDSGWAGTGKCLWIF